MTAIDLLPREMKERGSRRRRRLALVLAAGLVLLGTLWVRWEVALKIRFWEQELARVEAERRRLNRLVEKRAEIGRLEKLLAETTTGAGKGIHPWGELLRHLARITPPGAVWKQLTWDGKTLNFAGEARSWQELAVLARGLASCPYLTNISVSQVVRAAPGGPLTFTVSASWRE